MTTNFTIGAGQPLNADDEMALLAGIESALDLCLATGNVFAIFRWQVGFCQVLLDADHDMHIETTYGELAAHAGFHQVSEAWPAHRSNFLPASWHARAKIVAGAMTRAFIDAGKMEFPATLTVDILPAQTTAQPDAARPNPPPDAPTLGFLFASDVTMGEYVERLGPQLDLEPTASIWDVYDAVQRLVEADLGPLRRETAQPFAADHVVELDLDRWRLLH